MIEPTPEAYAEQLEKLLPRGRVWQVLEATRIPEVLLALADTLARIHVRALELIEEADPRTTLELLPDWERVTGIPNDCAPRADTIQERRTEVIAAYVNPGGQSIAFFTALAEALGYPGTIISELKPFRAGDRAGDALGGNASLFTWQVSVPDGAQTIPFRAGESVAGEALGTLQGNEQLICTFERYKPAHTQIVWVFG